MKLVMVTPYFFPKIGGLEKYAYSFAKSLQKHFGWEIVIITSNHLSKKDEVVMEKGIKVYRLSPLFKLSNTPINPFWYWKIKKILKQEKPDCINAHTPVPFIADVAALAAGNIPLLVTYHAFTLEKYNATGFNLLIKCYKVLEFALFQKAKKIIVPSKPVKSAIPAIFSKKVVVINNSVSSEDVVIRKANKKQKNPSIVFVSNLDKTHEWKGLQDVLLAVKMYKEKTKKDITLYVIGDGDNKKSYEQIAKDYGLTKTVQFVGRKIGKEKDAILAKATAGVIYPKSSNDGFPTVILEYWAQSLPVIAANILPINEILTDKKNALLVQPQNPSALAESIKKTITNTTLLKKIATGGYKELLAHHVLENEAQKFHKIANLYNI